jgi:hypothetical protein
MDNAVRIYGGVIRFSPESSSETSLNRQLHFGGDTQPHNSDSDDSDSDFVQTFKKISPSSFQHEVTFDVHAWDAVSAVLRGAPVEMSLRTNQVAVQVVTDGGAAGAGAGRGAGCAANPLTPKQSVLTSATTSRNHAKYNLFNTPQATSPKDLQDIGLAAATLLIKSKESRKPARPVSKMSAIFNGVSHFLQKVLNEPPSFCTISGNPLTKKEKVILAFNIGARGVALFTAAKLTGLLFYWVAWHGGEYPALNSADEQGNSFGEGFINALPLKITDWSGASAITVLAVLNEILEYLTRQWNLARSQKMLLAFERNIPSQFSALKLLEVLLQNYYRHGPDTDSYFGGDQGLQIQFYNSWKQMYLILTGQGTGRLPVYMEDVERELDKAEKKHYCMDIMDYFIRVIKAGMAFFLSVGAGLQHDLLMSFLVKDATAPNGLFSLNLIWLGLLLLTAGYLALKAFIMPGPKHKLIKESQKTREVKDQLLTQNDLELLKIADINHGGKLAFRIRIIKKQIENGARLDDFNDEAESSVMAWKDEKSVPTCENFSDFHLAIAVLTAKNMPLNQNSSTAKVMEVMATPVEESQQARSSADSDAKASQPRARVGTSPVITPTTAEQYRQRFASPRATPRRTAPPTPGSALRVASALRR